MARSQFLDFSCKANGQARVVKRGVLAYTGISKCSDSSPLLTDHGAIQHTGLDRLGACSSTSPPSSFKLARCSTSTKQSFFSPGVGAYASGLADCDLHPSDGLPGSQSSHMSALTHSPYYLVLDLDALCRYVGSETSRSAMLLAHNHVSQLPYTPYSGRCPKL